MSNSAIQLQPGEDGARGAPSERNKVMNGQFTYWQRGLVFPPPLVTFDGSQGIIADRWSWQATFNGGTFNLITDLGMARGDWVDPGDPASFGIDGDPKHFMRYQSTLTGSSGGAASNLVQRIERVEHFNGRQATLSFWARVEPPGLPGTIGISLLQFFGTGGSLPLPIPAPVDVALTNVWTYYTITFDIPSVIGKTLASNNDSLRVRFHNHIDAPIATIQGFVGPIAFTDILNLTNVQLELGPDATSYETQAEETVFGQVQRYYQQSYEESVPSGTPSAAGRVNWEANGGTGERSQNLPTTMRVAPSVSLFGFVNGVSGIADKTQGAAGTTIITTTSSSKRGFTWDYGFSGNAVDNFIYAHQFTADAEL